MRQNPKLKLLSLNGYYDLATPFAGSAARLRQDIDAFYDSITR